MRKNRLSALFLSLVMALSAMAVTGGVVSADQDEHPNIVVGVAIGVMDIDEARNHYKKANLAIGLLREIRHWVRNHNQPDFVANKCSTDYDNWLKASIRYARQTFMYFRGKATGWQEYPAGWERKAAKARAWLLYNRAVARQDDRTDDFLDCVYDNLPPRARFLLRDW